jgi:hypothetical protein
VTTAFDRPIVIDVDGSPSSYRAADRPMVHG